MKPASDPTQPLANQRHELFAQRLYRGSSYGDAWKATVPFGKEYKGGANALRVTGFRVSQRPEVAARVKSLREQAKQNNERGDEPLPQADIIRLNLGVSEALEAAYRAADAAHVAPQKLESLRRVLAAHLGRQGKLDEAQSTDLADPAVAVIVETAMTNISKMCTCPL